MPSRQLRVPIFILFTHLLITISVKPQAPVPAVLQNYKSVTAERLKNPEPENWLMNRRTYDGWGYSPLAQITTANVARLRPVWVFSSSDLRPHESPPLVNNGVLFVTSPANQVIAIDVKTGNLLWRFKALRPSGSVVPNDTNRGVALYGDKVYLALAEAVLVALDARTGKEVWRTTIADNKSGYYTTLSPMVADGKILLGASGGENGIRGFIAAFSAETGAEIWRTFTIPAPGEPGSETWPKGDQWKHGGTPVWVAGNYDPETNLAYWGTGNPGPYIGDQRPGDDLYSCSTLVIDVATGKIKGYFQYNPNDSWDWDEVSPPILLDYRRNGHPIKGLIDVARDGYLWFLERTNGGGVRFREAKPFVKQNVFKSIDPITGRPDVDAAHKPMTGKMAYFCPGWWGGKNWVPISFSPQTRMIYVPANNNICATGEGLPDVTYVPGKQFEGARWQFLVAPGADHIGEVQAWNVDTGERVWTHTYAKSSNWGGMLATAGGLVFSGGTTDRLVHAFDAATGKLLWEHPTNSAIIAAPTTFMLDGTQYLAVYSGYGGDARGMQGGLNRVFPGEFPEVPEGGGVWLFALEGRSPKRP
jgi:alcohol dehydrogenase (cytochrome c)